MTVNSAAIKSFLVQDPMYSGFVTDKTSDDDDLIASGALDSVGIFNLVAHLEKTYRISVEASDLTGENFSSIAAIVRFVRAKLQ